MNLRSSTRSLLLFYLLSALLIFASWHFYRGAFHEQGDIALNALRIDRAKSFQELYGNYSRFQFSHPGPVFWYLYAAAEGVLTDTLHWISPHAAHSLAGMFIQVGFYVLGLHLLSRFVTRPLFLPLALLIGALHFGEAGSAFLSVWPPHVILMPFFAFFAAAISISMGRGRDLIWLVLCGSFLVHGHVAQPLFVAVIALSAYALFWKRCVDQPEPLRPWKLYPRAHVVAILIMVLFLIPIFLDLAKGPESNIHAILQYLRYAQDRKKFLKTILYFLSFFSYVENQDDILQTLSWESAAFLRDHWIYYVAWTGLFVGVGWVARRGFGLARETLSFVRTVLLLWTLTAVLFLYWSRMQSGPMFRYNGYFFFSVSYVFLLLGAAILVEKLPKKYDRAFVFPLLLLAAVMAWKEIRFPEISEAESGMPIRVHTLAALAADPRAKAAKVLILSQPDWPEVASVALALTRAGVPFYVDPTWTFMYEKPHELSVEAATDPKRELSIWRFVHGKDTRGISITDDLKIAFEPGELSPTTGEIDFSDRGNLGQYQLFGFSTPAPGDYAPTSRTDALLQFKPLPADTDIELHMVAEPFLGAGNQRVQPTELRFNGNLVFSAPFTEPGVLRARIPKEMWNSLPIATVRLTMPNAQSPAEMGLSGDIRRLGLSVKKLTTRKADPMP